MTRHDRAIALADHIIASTKRRADMIAKGASIEAQLVQAHIDAQKTRELQMMDDEEVPK
jgi:hypothetical protein